MLDMSTPLHALLSTPLAAYCNDFQLKCVCPDFAEPATVEGEQVIMSFQVARFLIKTIKEIADGKPVFGSVEYLKEEPLQGVQVNSWEVCLLLLHTILTAAVLVAAVVLLWLCIDW